MKFIRLYFQQYVERKKYVHFFISLVFLLAFTLHSFVLPELVLQNLRLQNSLSRLENEIKLKRNQPPQNHTNTENLKTFHNTLEQSNQIEKSIRWLFDLAEKNNISINKAQIKYSTNENTEIDATEVQFPVQGNYIVIREFCEDFLLSTPFASLDEIKLKRSASNGQTVEGTLRFTFLSIKSKSAITPTKVLLSRDK